jgi:hypothetical protein
VNRLQFSDDWFRLGLLTDTRLSELTSEFESSDDQNSEHYRYRVFCEFLKAQRSLSTSMAEDLFELGRIDPDSVLGVAMMADIVSSPGCDKTVLDKALGSGEVALVRVAIRAGLLAEINAGLTQELFDRCLESGDSVIERTLLEKDEISLSQIQQLAIQGSSKAVRNIAAERLRSLS